MRFSRSTIVMLVAWCVAGCATTDERWRTFNQDGVQAFARGDYRNALDCFDYAMTFRPQDPVLIFNMAQCYDRMGNVKKAEELYAYCLQRDANHGDAHLALIEMKYRTGRVAEANQQILEWQQQNPGSADALVADAWRLRQEKGYSLANARLQQALSLDGQNRRALTELALLCEAQGMPDRALVLYEEILTREPNQIEIAERAQKLKAQGVRRPRPN